MEDQTPKKNNMMIMVPVAIAAVVILGVAGVFAYQNMQNPPSSNQAPEAMISQAPESTTDAMELSYKDGTYDVVGTYVSPGGSREVNVTVTIKDGVVTDSTFEGLATDATSKRFQGEFAEGYKTQVVGKNIDKVSLTKVSGSSLTPKGFNDALEKVKAEAKV